MEQLSESGSQCDDVTRADIRLDVLAALRRIPAEFREVVAGSDLIAYGRVAEVRPQWADQRRKTRQDARP